MLLSLSGAHLGLPLVHDDIDYFVAAGILRLTFAGGQLNRSHHIAQVDRLLVLILSLSPLLQIVLLDGHVMQIVVQLV